MAERYFNHFQGIDVEVPIEYRDKFGQYCQTGTGGRTDLDKTPFPRMVDLWFLAVCVATRLGLDPVDKGKRETYKLIEGSIFGGDPWRIHALTLISLAIAKDLQVVGEPRRMMSIANGLAIVGLPHVFEMLEKRGMDPVWAISDAITELLDGHAADVAKQATH